MNHLEERAIEQELATATTSRLQCHVNAMKSVSVQWECDHKLCNFQDAVGFSTRESFLRVTMKQLLWSSRNYDRSLARK